MSTSLLQTYPISLHACKLAKKRRLTHLEVSTQLQCPNNGIWNEYKLAASLPHRPACLHACKLAKKINSPGGEHTTPASWQWNLKWVQACCKPTQSACMLANLQRRLNHLEVSTQLQHHDNGTWNEYKLAANLPHQLACLQTCKKKKVNSPGGDHTTPVS